MKLKKSDFQPFIGTGENSYIGNVAKLYHLDVSIEKAKARTYQIYGELVQDNLILLPGVREFIAFCKTII
ncbi:MAG: hypothetical protein HC906_07445 [Bacteroidales bacterium]|nr:hypothetical protein [Bacteroidales bacterium]